MSTETTTTPIDQQQEIWKEIPGILGYRVSSLGNIQSRWRKGHWSTSLTNDWKPKSIHIVPTSGYFFVHLTLNRKQINRYVHRLVLEAFVGPCPDGMQGRHLDGNKFNNRLTNLAWGTPIENAADCARHGNRPQGETCGASKLTVAQVLEMRRLYAEGKPFAHIAPLFGVADNTVARAVRRISWKHI